MTVNLNVSFASWDIKQLMNSIYYSLDVYADRTSICNNKQMKCYQEYGQG